MLIDAQNPEIKIINIGITFVIIVEVFFTIGILAFRNDIFKDDL